MKALYSFIGLILISNVSLCQKRVVEFANGHRIKNSNNGSLYLFANNDEFRFFTEPENNANHSKVKTNTEFIIEKGRTNIYAKWQNPLKYKFTWKDTLISDEFDEIQKQFFDLLTSQFKLDSNLQSILQQKEMTATSNISKASQIINQFKADLLIAGANSSQVITKKYIDSDLALWNLSLPEKKGDGLLEVKKLNEFLTIIAFSEKLSTYPMGESIFALIDQLTEIKNPENFRQGNAVYQSVSDSITKLKNYIKEYDNSIDQIDSEDLSSIFDEKTKLFNSSEAVIENFKSESKKRVKQWNSLISHFQEIRNILEKSVNNTSLQPVNGSNYMFLRGVELPESKIIKTELKIEILKYSKEDQSFKIDKTSYSEKMNFTRFRKLIPTLSIGAYYTSLRPTLYESVKNGDDQNVISEKNQKDWNLGGSLMLNYYLNISDSDILPIIQLGADPTKKRPFFLVGGGFGVPSYYFSITTGATFGWDQKLNDGVNIGDVIDGDDDLKNKTHFSFNPEPKLYLGIQVNF